MDSGLAVVQKIMKYEYMSCVSATVSVCFGFGSLLYLWLVFMQHQHSKAMAEISLINVLIIHYVFILPENGVDLITHDGNAIPETIVREKHVLFISTGLTSPETGYKSSV